MPCASVSAKRTFTSVEKPKSTAELFTIADAFALVRLIRARSSGRVVEAVVTQNIDPLHERAGTRNLSASTRADAVRPVGRSKARGKCGSRPRCRRRRLDCLGGSSSQGPFLEQAAALAAVHARDLVRNAFPLAQQVAGHLCVPVWGPERNWLAHLTQGNSALGK